MSEARPASRREASPRSSLAVGQSPVFPRRTVRRAGVTVAARLARVSRRAREALAVFPESLDDQRSINVAVAERAGVVFAPEHTGHHVCTVLRCVTPQRTTVLSCGMCSVRARGVVACDVACCRHCHCHRNVHYRTVLYSALLYSTLLYSTLLYTNVLYCTVLYCTVLYSNVLYCTVLHCIVLY